MTVWAVGMGALGAEARSAARRGWSLLDEVQRIGSRSGAEPVALRAAREFVEAARAQGGPIRYAIGPGHVSAPGGVVHFAVDPSASIYPVWFGIGIRALVVHPEATVEGLTQVIDAVATSGRSTGPTATMPGPGRDGAPLGAAPGVFVERADRFIEEQRRRHRAFLVPYEQIVADLVEPGFSESLRSGRTADSGEPTLVSVGSLPLRETELMGAAIDRAVATLEGAGQDADEAALRLQSESAEESMARAQVAHLVTVLVRLGQQPDRPVSEAHLSAAVAGALEILLAQDDTDGFQGGLRGVYSVAQAWTGREGITATVGRALETAVVGPLSAASVARHFERVDPSQVQWFNQWFAQRGAMVPAAQWFSAFDGLPAGPGRRFLQGLLTARPEVDRGWWLAQARDGGHTAQAEALEILASQALSEGERLLFVGSMIHPDADTRMRAAALLALDGSEMVREGLGRMLLDPVRAVRQSALAALVKRGAPQDARFVAAVMRTPRYADLSTDEQERMAESLARLGGDHYLRVFRELLRIEEASRLGRLFRRETIADDPIRRAAVHGLGALGTAEALALLEQVKKRGAAPLDGFAAQVIEACMAGAFTRRDLTRAGTRPEVFAVFMPVALDIQEPVDLDAGWRLIEPEAFGLTPTLSLEALLMGYLDDAESRPSALPGQSVAPGALVGSIGPVAQPFVRPGASIPPGADAAGPDPVTEAPTEAVFELPDPFAPPGLVPPLVPAGPPAPPAWAVAPPDASVDFESLNATLGEVAQEADALAPLGKPEPLGPPEAEPDGDEAMVGPGLAWPTPGTDAPGRPSWEEPPAPWMAEASDQALWAETPKAEGAATAAGAPGISLPGEPALVAPELAELLAELEAPGPPAPLGSGGGIKRVSALVTTGRLPDELDVDPHHDGVESEGPLSVGPPPLLAVAMRSLDTLPSLDTLAPAEPLRRMDAFRDRPAPEAQQPPVVPAAAVAPPVPAGGPAAPERAAPPRPPGPPPLPGGAASGPPPLPGVAASGPPPRPGMATAGPLRPGMPAAPGGLPPRPSVPTTPGGPSAMGLLPPRPGAAGAPRVPMPPAQSGQSAPAFEAPGATATTPAAMPPATPPSPPAGAGSAAPGSPAAVGETVPSLPPIEPPFQARTATATGLSMSRPPQPDPPPAVDAGAMAGAETPAAEATPPGLDDDVWPAPPETPVPPPKAVPDAAPAANPHLDDLLGKLFGDKS